MSSRALAGYCLILSPLVILIGSLLNPHGFDNWSDTKGLLASLGGDPGLTSVSVLLISVGFILFAAGFAGIRDEMSDGSSAKYMKIAVIFMIIGVAGTLGESGLIAASAGAAAAPEGRGMATAIALITGAEGVGAMSTSISFIGFALAGTAFLIGKNYHMIVGGLITISGILGIYAASTDYYSNLMAAAFLVWVIMTVVTGVLTIRSKA